MSKRKIVTSLKITALVCAPPVNSIESARRGDVEPLAGRIEHQWATAEECKFVADWFRKSCSRKKSEWEARDRQIVACVRALGSAKAAAREFGVSLRTVVYALEAYGDDYDRKVILRTKR